MSGRNALLPIGLFLCVTALLVSCDTDEASLPSTPPTITSVTPTGAVGAANAEATFSAVATGAPTSWEWDFGVATLPRTSPEKTPTVILVDPGTFAASVKACNAAGCSDPFPFTLEIAPSAQAPVILSVQPIGVVGEPGDTVTFSVTTDRVATAWGWDFGGGTIPATSEVESPTVTLGAPGTYTGTLTVCVPVLAACSEKWTFTYTVAAP